MSTDLTIRAGGIDDIPAIAAIERASFADPWSESSFGELVRMRGTIFLVACRGVAAAVGYLMAHVFSDQAEILNLAVMPMERRRGVGAELLDAGLASVRKAGAGEVFLDVRESNQGALALYSSRGFAALSRRKGYYRNPVEDALVLRRAIE